MFSISNWHNLTFKIFFSHFSASGVQSFAFKSFVNVLSEHSRSKTLEHTCSLAFSKFVVFQKAKVKKKKKGLFFFSSITEPKGKSLDPVGLFLTMQPRHT